MNVERSICQAINLLADAKIANTDFDRTVTAYIKELVDQTSGKYIVKYGDSQIEAFATSNNIFYEQGQQVSVLIPSDDGVKTILSSKDNYAANYTEVANASNKFNQIGPNVISCERIIKISSYKTGKQPIYDKDNKEDVNSKFGITIDQEAAKLYIQKGDGICLGTTIQTNFDVYQIGGDYGLIFNLQFVDDETKSAAVVPYYVTSRDLIGNPYLVIKPTKIKHLYDQIETGNFNCIESIEVFVKDFALQDDEKEDDIYFSNLQIIGAEILTSQKLEGYTVHLNYGQNGNILKENSIDTVSFQAELKSKGKTITENVQYYWFRENALVLDGHNKYCSKGGYGWECLNNYDSNGRVIPATSNKINFVNSPDKVEEVKIKVVSFNNDQIQENDYSDNTDPLTVFVFQKETKIKCVAIRGIIETEGFESVINQNVRDIYIDSSDKIGGTNQNRTIYYRDSGSPTLTCIVENQKEGKHYDYTWSVITNRGQVIDKTASDDWEDTNNRYNEAKEAYEEAKTAYDAMDEYGKSEYQETLTSLYNTYQALDTERIEDNIYHKFPIKSIYSSSRIVCSVKQSTSQQEESIYIGSASITLQNHMELQDTYSLILENSSQVFQYDDKGNSPASAQLQKPITILPLSFKLFDDSGNEVSYEQIINNGYVEWLVPKENTLLIPKLSSAFLPVPAEWTYGTDKALSADFDIYKDNAALKNAIEQTPEVDYIQLSTFPFSIAQSFDNNKNNNYIRLDIKYKDFLFSVYSNFTFPKEGDPGTNGTNKLAKIVPYNGDNKVTGNRLYYNLLDSSEAGNVGEFFTEDGFPFDRLKFLLYNNGRELQLPGTVSIAWTSPPEVYDSQKTSLYKQGCFNVNDEGKVSLLQSYSIDDIDDIKNDQPINIVRGQYNENDLKYFAEIPICYSCMASDKSDYRIKLKSKSGFQYVVYEDDGTSPNYDDALPFEVIVQQKNQDGYYITQDSSSYKYTWEVIGEQIINDKSKTNTTYQHWYKPIDYGFDSSKINNAILIEVTGIGFLYVPIYMIVNRYGHAALNSWDGNAIQLGQDENGNPTGLILAPQVGAGKKDENNAFTGVLIGQQKVQGTDGVEEKTGLFGYGQGERSIFLDADTGDATFGKSGAGQIKIEAQSGEGTISSGDYSTVPGEEGGMKIKFSSTSKEGDQQGPYIKYGNNNFSVSSNGHIHAAGGGDIANWNIDDNKIYKHTDNNLTGMASTNWLTSDINATFPSTNDSVAFYAASINNGSTIPNFYVTHGGDLYSQSGKIGSWDINKNNLTNGNVGLGTPGNATTFSYAGTSTIIPASSIRLWSDDNFIVTNNGKLYANSAQIGPWALSSSALTNDNVGMGSWSTKLPVVFNEGNSEKNLHFWAKSNSSSSSINFAVDSTGKIYSRAGKIGGWTIGDNTLSNSHSNGNNISIYASTAGGYIKGTGNNKQWAINIDGTVNFTAGTIGGCDIGSSFIKSSDNNWIISNDGSVTFKNGTIGGVTISSTSLSGTGFKITPTYAEFTGLKIDSNGIQTTNTGGISGNNSCGFNSSGNMYASPSNLYTDSGQSQTFGDWLSATFDNLIVNKTFIYNGLTAKWQAFSAIYMADLQWSDVNVQGGAGGTVRVPTILHTTSHTIFTLGAVTSS